MAAVSAASRHVQHHLAAIWCIQPALGVQPLQALKRKGAGVGGAEEAVFVAHKLGRGLRFAQDQCLLGRRPAGWRAAVLGKDVDGVGAVGEIERVDLGPARRLAAPGDRVEVVFGAENFVEQAAQVMGVAVVAVEPEGAGGSA